MRSPPARSARSPRPTARSPRATFTCTTSAPLTVGTSISYQLTLAIAPDYVLPSLTNTASITSTPLVDPDGSNDAATDVDTVTASADLSITKTDGVTTVKPGSSTTFTITVTNNGPSDVPAGVVVTDQIPAGTVASETEANCTLAGDDVHVHDDGPVGGRARRSSTA